MSSKIAKIMPTLKRYVPGRYLWYRTKSSLGRHAFSVLYASAGLACRYLWVLVVKRDAAIIQS